MATKWLCNTCGEVTSHGGACPVCASTDVEPLDSERDVVLRRKRDLDAGLYRKYIVFDTDTEVETDGFCFVLKPETDSAAWDALQAYALSTTNPQLGADLMRWLNQNLRSVEVIEF